MRYLIVVLLLFALVSPVSAAEITAPEVVGEAADLMPDQTISFGEGAWYIIKKAVKKVQPELVTVCKLCVCVVAVAMLSALMEAVPGGSKYIVGLVGCTGVALVLLGDVTTLIHRAADTVQEVSDYGKLLLPVIAASEAAQGASSHAAALYTATAFFDAILCNLISGIMIPMVYMYLAIVYADAAIGEELLKRIKNGMKSFICWTLKTMLYVYTGYISITGIISGAADKTVLKAAKLTISGAVPVIGGIMSDATESILVGASLVKNTVGTYGLIAILAIVVLPFLEVGLMYLLLKGTAAVCAVFTSGNLSGLVRGFSEGMGFLLGLTGAVSLLLLISIICFMKGATI